MFQMSDDKRSRGRGSKSLSMDGSKSRSRKLEDVKKNEVRKPSLLNNETSGMDFTFVIYKRHLDYPLNLVMIIYCRIDLA